MADSGSQTRNGYCSACQLNIVHVRRVRNRWLRGFAKTRPRLSRWLHLGSWHCIQCGQDSWRLPATRPEARQFQFPQTDAERDADGTETAGNFIRTERSLVLRSNRVKRFTEKYRDAVVHRLMEGRASLTQMREELNLSEGELMDWIADLLGRKQARIDELTIWLETMATGRESPLLSSTMENPSELVDLESRESLPTQAKSRFNP